MAITNTAADVTAAAPDGPSGTATGGSPDRAVRAVWDALTANAGASVSDVATAAGVSKNAARRALAALADDGRATRTPGGRDGGKRAPDAWHATAARPATDADEDPIPVPEAADETADEPDTDEPDTVTTDESDTDRQPTNAEPPLAGAPENVAEPGDGETGTTADEASLDATAVADAREALTALGAEIVSTLDALRDGDRSAALASADKIYAGSGKARRLVRAAAGGRPRNASGKAKSHPGELRAKVAAHLAAYPDQEFTPHEIGKAIGHSAGAVANALDRLATDGTATETCDRPRRFQATTPDGDGPTATD